MSNLFSPIEKQRRPGARPWTIRGYRPEPSSFMFRLRRKQSQPFGKKLGVAAETRYLALYCCDEEFTLQFVCEKTGIHMKKMANFFNHYGLDLKSRNFKKETH